MIVELVGMVGAGKSTLVAAVAGATLRTAQGQAITVITAEEAICHVVANSRLGRRLRLRPNLDAGAGIAYRRVLRPGFVAALAVRHPRTLILAARSLWAAPISGRHLRTIMRRVSRSGALVLFLRDRLPDDIVVIVDEGPIHRAVNAFAWAEHGIDRLAIERFVAAAPATDLILVVKAADAGLRARSRGLPERVRLAAATDDRLAVRFMTNAQEVCDTVAEMLPQTGRRWQLITNDGAIERSAETALAAIGQVHGAMIGEPAPSRATDWGVPIFDPPTSVVPRVGWRRSPRSAASLTGSTVDAVLAEFGLDRRGDLVNTAPASRADNVVVETDAGTKLVKRYKDTVAASTVVHEHSILTELCRIGFPSARLWASPCGATSVQFDGDTFAVYDYLAGYTHFHHHLMRPRDEARLIAQSAQTLACLHRALVDFVPDQTHPNGFETRDGPHIRPLDWYLGQVQTADERSADLPPAGRQALRSALSEHRATVEAELRTIDGRLRGAGLRRGVIHGDYGPHNLMVKPHAGFVVIDFEIARRDWLVFDLAKSLATIGIRRGRLRPQRIRHFVASYARSPSACVPTDELPLVPDAWRYLLLRRAAVCWVRFANHSDQAWLHQAERLIARAQAVHHSAASITHGQPSAQSTGVPLRGVPHVAVRSHGEPERRSS